MQKILITKEKSGIRLDKFLAGEFFSLSRGGLIKKIKEALVLVNNEVPKPSLILKEGDALSILFSPDEPILLPNPKVPLDIIFENADLLVINKAAGIQVHPSNNEKYFTIVNKLLAYLPAISTVHDDSTLAHLRPGIVHRLDKDTSGAMVIAKNQETFDALKRLFKDRQVTKKYLALVSGQLKEKNGVIEKELAKAANYKKQIVANSKTKTKIRPAITEYTVLKEYAACSLVEARPKTGRMHQIRVHLASLGHPIIGDSLYGSNIEGFEGVPRQLLHAQELSFQFREKKYVFLAPLPADFSDFLAQQAPGGEK